MDLGQQFFILRKMPPGSAAHKAKADADKPYVDPKTLAPKPGAKPVRSKPGRAATTAASSTPPLFRRRRPRWWSVRGSGTAAVPTGRRTSQAPLPGLRRAWRTGASAKAATCTDAGPAGP